MPEYNLLKPFTFVVRQYASSCLLITCKRDYKKCIVIPYKKILNNTSTKSQQIDGNLLIKLIIITLLSRGASYLLN